MKKLFVLVMLSRGVAALGADKPEPESQLQPKAAPLVGRSEAARSQRSFGLGGRLGGILGASGSAIEGYYYLDQANQIGLMLGGRNASSFADRIDEDAKKGVSGKFYVANLSGSLLQAQWRHFFGNSFSILVGAGTRAMVSTIEIDDVTDTVSTFDFVGTAAIGNMWLWDSGFYMGVDWIGATVPMSSRARKSRSTQARQSQEVEAFLTSAENEGVEAGKRGYGLGLLLAVGGSF